MVTLATSVLAKVSLNSGESTELTLSLDSSAFAFYDPEKSEWKIEPGVFTLNVGSSSSDIRLKLPITIN
ncbi:fibronectin type III-like domain-contianing protein [Pelagicoccus mobilis]|uniref:Fibronectin type III-like domain-contianing protein n=2 Tax=Pelagicoccus mobilis TaxID=415221 RepID=A0A934S4M4_9BACT|nr:fibronectin type III-like domain-contianing protein [Pelagicoccus mobilis]